MVIRKPKFFDEFHCIASACPDSCCQEWAVVIDGESESLYRAMPGALGEAIRKHLTVEDGETVLKTLPNGRCPMWREDGLCRIQAEAGEGALSCVCSQFPRISHDYGDFVEWGLELSCPEAARILFSARWDWEETRAEAEGEPEYDADAMAILKSARAGIISLMQDESYSLQDALAISLLFGYRMQEILDGEEAAAFEAEAALHTAKEMAAEGDMEAFYSFFMELEILREHWRKRLEEPKMDGAWELLRNAAVYFADRYILQAISDYDLVSRVKLMVISCIAIRNLGGDMVQTAQEYSKEIENDAENLDALLDGAYTEPAFADAKLLGLLLGSTGE